MKDTARNASWSVQDVVAAIRARRSPLILTHRTEHLESLANDLRAVCEVIVLKGGMGKKQRLGLRIVWRSFRVISPESFSRLAVTLARDSMIHCSTLSF